MPELQDFERLRDATGLPVARLINLWQRGYRVCPIEADRGKINDNGSDSRAEILDQLDRFERTGRFDISNVASQWLREVLTRRQVPDSSERQNPAVLENCRPDTSRAALFMQSWKTGQAILDEIKSRWSNRDAMLRDGSQEALNAILWWDLLQDETRLSETHKCTEIIEFRHVRLPSWTGASRVDIEAILNLDLGREAPNHWTGGAEE